MKKILLILAFVSCSILGFADCDTPSGYEVHTNGVYVKLYSRGEVDSNHSFGGCTVYVSNTCGTPSYKICAKGTIYAVSTSDDTSKGAYMFYMGNWKYYFNM